MGSGSHTSDEPISITTSLTRTQLRMLTEIRNNPNITKAKLAESLDVGKTTIDNGIAALKKYGYLERVGSNKSGYWNVRK